MLNFGVMHESGFEAPVDVFEEFNLQIPTDIPSVNEVQHYISQQSDKKLNTALFCVLQTTRASNDLRRTTTIYYEA